MASFSAVAVLCSAIGFLAIAHADDTCASFDCPKDMHLRGHADQPSCAPWDGCSAQICCLESHHAPTPATAPAPSSKPTPAPAPTPKPDSPAPTPAPKPHKQHTTMMPLQHKVGIAVGSAAAAGVLAGAIDGIVESQTAHKKPKAVKVEMTPAPVAVDVEIPVTVMAGRLYSNDKPVAAVGTTSATQGVLMSAAVFAFFACFFLGITGIIRYAVVKKRSTREQTFFRPVMQEAFAMEDDLEASSLAIE